MNMAQTQSLAKRGSRLNLVQEKLNSIRDELGAAVGDGRAAEGRLMIKKMAMEKLYVHANHDDYFEWHVHCKYGSRFHERICVPGRR